MGSVYKQYATDWIYVETVYVETQLKADLRVQKSALEQKYQPGGQGETSVRTISVHRLQYFYRKQVSKLQISIVT